MRHHAIQAWNNRAHDVRAKARKGVIVPIAAREEFLEQIQAIWPRDMRCPACGVAMGWKCVRQPDDSKIPSVHKIVPATGYVAGNMAVLCTGCNSTISDADTLEKVNRKRAALDFQATQVELRRRQ